MHIVVGEVDYVLGQIHSGHYEAILSDFEFFEFQKMSEKDQKKYIAGMAPIIKTETDIYLSKPKITKSI